MTECERIEQIRARLRHALPPGSRAFLFGARARGHTDLIELYPDFRILVVEPTVDSRVAEAARLREALGRVDAPIELTVLDEDRVRARAAIGDTAVAYAVREGELLVQT